jgi:DNA-binding LacI/PurR family transcriptional regulator
MGVLAAALLIDHVEGRHIDKRQVMLQTQLEVRGSTTKPAAAPTSVMKTA